MSKIISLFFAIFLASSAITLRSDAVEYMPTQQFNPETCGLDEACLRHWYSEYKENIVNELMFWRSFENDICDNDSLKANEDIALAIKRKQYKHNHWVFYRGITINGLDEDDINTLINFCRVAIIDIKYMIMAESDDRKVSAKDRQEYFEDITICERKFELKPLRSCLRSE